ncbi:hypothetical protein [Mucisphaera sp.]|uniref:hypothetical protein n=1 Tax=Mucisphaera sp. TaxID=2913024 RepID=UPI003D0F1470
MIPHHQTLSPRHIRPLAALLALISALLLISSTQAAAQTLDHIAVQELPWPTDTPFTDQRQTIIQHAAEHGESDALSFERARIEHLIGAAGDRKLAQAALERLQTLAKQYPDDPIIKAYLGSAKMLRAQRVWWFMTKGKLVREGGDLLEQAIQADPDNAELHALAGVSVQNLPDWMDQATRARDEITLARELVKAEDAPNRWTPAVRALILEAYGALRLELDQPDEARDAFREAVRIAPNADAGQRAAQRLSELDP